MVGVTLYTNFAYVQAEPYLSDESLKLEKVYEGLEFPVSMSFLGSDDLIILEKNNGTIQRIVNGVMLSEPLLKINVNSIKERGLLGSEVGFDVHGKMNIFLYFTEEDEAITDKENSTKGLNTLFNRIYKYDLIDGKLGNPKLLISLPTNEIPLHNGGKLTIGPDNNLYAIVGDIAASKAITQNIINGTKIDGTGGILRLTFDGSPIEGLLGNTYPLNYYFAYGIRNGFGLDFDPLTGHLWDTENGQLYGDEINLVGPGFNSGWKKVQGIWEPLNEQAGKLFFKKNDLVMFNNKTHYSSPEVTWSKTIAITSLKFLNNSNLGDNYRNDLFVGDFNYGNLYHFDLDSNRTKVVDNSSLTYDVSLGNEDILIVDFDRLQNCNNAFNCYVVSDDLSSNLRSRMLMVSTPVETVGWSMISGEAQKINPKQDYKITTMMKLNPNVRESNLLIQGFSEESRLWVNIDYCPEGIDGPIKWIEFTCIIHIPDNVFNLRAVFNGGYSEEKGKEAITWFRNTTIEKNNSPIDLFPIFNQTNSPIIGRGFGHIADIQVGPDGNLYILSIRSENRESLEVFDNSEDDYIGSIYRIVKR